MVKLATSSWIEALSMTVPIGSRVGELGASGRGGGDAPTDAYG